MSALILVRLLIVGLVLLTVAASLLLASRAQAFREDERSFPQPRTDESIR